MLFGQNCWGGPLFWKFAWEFYNVTPLPPLQVKIQIDNQLMLDINSWEIINRKNMQYLVENVLKKGFFRINKIN
jgi:hypothetical protein